MPNQQSTLKFTGLNLTSDGGELSPGASPVFHNCDIAPDGDVVRRPGSNYLGNIVSNATGGSWSHVIKTRRGTEFLVTVTQSGIVIQVLAEDDGTASVTGYLQKLNVFSRTLTDVNFVLLPTPYDRLLVLTNNHPPIQLSFLERTATFTCTNAAAGTITAPFETSDSKLWRGNTTSGIMLFNLPSGSYFYPSSKSAGFTLNVPSLGMVLNETRELVLTSVSWQWWAESLNWSGGDFSQNTVRYSSTAIDQNVKIPTALLTDIDARYLTSAYRGIILTLGNDGATTGFVPPVLSPTTALEWAHGSGQRFIYTSTNAPLHTPFFATFQGIEAVGTQTPHSYHRTREIRFNAGTGCTGTNLDFYVDGVKKIQRFATSPAFADGDYLCYKDTYTTQRNIVGASVVADLVTGIFPLASGRPLSTQVDTIMSNTERKWLGSSARSVLATDLPVGGGELDGCYVPAFGIGLFCDYLRGIFPTFGCLFRDRLVLRLPETSSDQLIFSATGDELSPGNFYNFFQITDALEGVVDDPFTINITSKSREKLTALLAWQQSLFIFTAVSTYSLTGGEVFGPESYTTGLVASYGAFNARSVIATNLTVLFLNRYGVFDLMNKNNTTDYGSFERSEAVRPIFASHSATQAQSKLPWLCLNDTTNKVYVGLPLRNDTTACQQVLSLNLAWNSWSTLGSATPFNVTAAVQMFNFVLFTVLSRNTGASQLLQMDALHHLDFFLRTYGLSTTAVNFAYPAQSTTALVSADKIVDLPHPTPPILREYFNTTKTGTTYVANANSFSTLLPRNWMADVQELVPLLPPPSSYYPIVLIKNEEPFALYPTAGLGGGGDLITLNGVTSLTGASIESVDGIATIYNSTFATTAFNTESLGRLKRLKKLHLLFDNTGTKGKKYYTLANSLQNSAVILISYNYGDNEYLADAQLFGDYTRLDAQRLNLSPSASRQKQLSIPLQGYGANYQLYVCSTGGDAFKLTSYEFDVQPQRTKTFVRD